MGSTPVVRRSQDSDGDTDGSTPGSVDGSSSGAQGGFFKQLQDAVTSALGSSGNTSDPNSLIQAAIKQLFAGQTQAQQSPSTSNQPAAASDSDGDTDGSTSANASDTAGASGNAQQSAFSQLLNSFGVSSQQFQKDVQTALQSSSSNGGAVDVSKLFKSFPPGSVIDTLA